MCRTALKRYAALTRERLWPNICWHGILGIASSAPDLADVRCNPHSSLYSNMSWISMSHVITKIAVCLPSPRQGLYDCSVSQQREGASSPTVHSSVAFWLPEMHRTYRRPPPRPNPCTPLPPYPPTITPPIIARTRVSEIWNANIIHEMKPHTDATDNIRQAEVDVVWYYHLAASWSFEA